MQPEYFAHFEMPTFIVEPKDGKCSQCEWYLKYNMASSITNRAHAPPALDVKWIFLTKKNLASARRLKNLENSTIQEES